MLYTLCAFGLTLTRRLSNSDPYTFGRMSTGKRFLPLRLVWKTVYRVVPPLRFDEKSIDETSEPDTAGLRWFHLGSGAAAEMLRRHGFDLVDQDIGISHRDPILHFRKL
jgi:hypothetical protein